MSQQVVTANRLADGVVVFLGLRGWVEELDKASVASTAEAVNEVVDAYLIEVAAEHGRLQPTALRERLRARGPSVRLDLGKQAAAAGGSHVSL